MRNQKIIKSGLVVLVLVLSGLLIATPVSAIIGFFGCPDDFTRLEIIGNPEDRNDNGVICTKEVQLPDRLERFSIIIDDIFPLH